MARRGVAMVPVDWVPLGAEFFARPTVEVAKDLLGKLIVNRGAGVGIRAARIVEVEAYLGLEDAASHARRGPTPRAAIMFGPPGRLYVYLVYGMHHCVNVVTETDGVAGAVLLRAAAPVLGFDDPGAPGREGAAARRPLSGPGRLCAAMGITRQHNGLDLSRGPISIARAQSPDGDGSSARKTGDRIKRSARVGVAYAGPWANRPLRFYFAGNPYVSARPR